MALIFLNKAAVFRGRGCSLIMGTHYLIQKEWTKIKSF